MIALLLGTFIFTGGTVGTVEKSSSMVNGQDYVVYLNDPILTPGVVDPTKTKTILCAKGYTTKSVRPPASYTSALKIKQMKAWGLPGKPQDYEQDHLDPLCLGGAPRDPLNLWPQRHCLSGTGGKSCFGADEKDELEKWLCRRMCAGLIDQGKAQELIRTDWYSLYRTMKNAP